MGLIRVSRKGSPSVHGNSMVNMCIDLWNQSALEVCWSSLGLSTQKTINTSHLLDLHL